MADPVSPIPKGYEGVIPYLYVRGAAEAIDFYRKAFDAEETLRMPNPDGAIGHAELRIHGAMVMLADEVPDRGIRSPQTLGGTSAGFVLYAEDVDAVFQRAIEAGAVATQPVEDKFYGDRAGTLADPFGHEWTVMTHVEDVLPEEMERRIAAQQG